MPLLDSKIKWGVVSLTSESGYCKCLWEGRVLKQELGCGLKQSVDGDNFPISCLSVISLLCGILRRRWQIHSSHNTWCLAWNFLDSCQPCFRPEHGLQNALVSLFGDLLLVKAGAHISTLSLVKTPAAPDRVECAVLLDLKWKLARLGTHLLSIKEKVYFQPRCVV